MMASAFSTMYIQQEKQVLCADNVLLCGKGSSVTNNQNLDIYNTILCVSEKCQLCWKIFLMLLSVNALHFYSALHLRIPKLFIYINILSLATPVRLVNTDREHRHRDCILPKRSQSLLHIWNQEPDLLALHVRLLRID